MYPEKLPSVYCMTMMLVGIFQGVSTSVNLARNGAASQSSTNFYGSDIYFDWVAGLATDGDKSERYHIDNQPTCTATRREKNSYPWWQVDLHSDYFIETIIVYGRLEVTEQLRGFRLFVSSMADENKDLDADLIFKDSFSPSTYNANKGTYLINVQRRGRYVKIDLERHDAHLILCEVEVYGCPLYYFGNDCSEKCGYCKNDTPCHSGDGSCLNGCAPGFRLDLCKDGCEAGQYAENCTQSCGNCKDVSACDKVDGRCKSCSAGYRGLTCKQVCSKYTFGENCSSECGHCRNGRVCNHITGSCYDCKNGYDYDTDVVCKTECKDGFYGYRCHVECGQCKDAAICNKTDGYCDSGCEPGYKGKRCRTPCPDGTFGDGCSMKCHCKDDSVCNITTGVCPSGECAFGWSGNNCSIDLNLIQQLRKHSVMTDMATPDYGGMNSTLAIDGNDSPLPDECHCCSVSHAKNPWWILDLQHLYPIQRVVFVGRAGYKGCTQFEGFRMYLSNKSGDFGEPMFHYRESCAWWSTDYIVNIPVANVLARFVKIDRIGDILTICEVKLYEGDCVPGRYGNECMEECHCSDGLICDRNSGDCQSPGCDPGWNGTACNRECNYATFGNNCTGVCHCADNGYCNKISGVCETGGCAAGWLGYNCSKACEPGKFGTNCSNPCRCQIYDSCNHVTGSCEAGFCERGFQGKNCSLTCNPGVFGLNCNNKCHCLSSATCHHVNGSCEDGLCDHGYQGRNCSLQNFDLTKEAQQAEDTQSTQWIVVGLSIFVAVIVITAAVLFSKRRLFAKQSHSTAEIEVIKGDLATDNDISETVLNHSKSGRMSPETSKTEY